MFSLYLASPLASPFGANRVFDQAGGHLAVGLFAGAWSALGADVRRRRTCAESNAGTIDVAGYPGFV
jgi:hypothetical protein